jgi:hypothetical protein
VLDGAIGRLAGDFKVDGVTTDLTVVVEVTIASAFFVVTVVRWVVVGVVFVVR